ncbi:MAG: hypothetical protein N2171_07140 [Clostridia bacterium]|nr:hypothetical protein [Clostridia bacterium]
MQKLPSAAFADAASDFSDSPKSIGDKKLPTTAQEYKTPLFHICRLLSFTDPNA